MSGHRQIMSDGDWESDLEHTIFYHCVRLVCSSSSYLIQRSAFTGETGCLVQGLSLNSNGLLQWLELI